MLLLLGNGLLAQEAGLPAIDKVEIRDRVFYVNGKPFFPLMAWLQDAKNLPILKECGMNSTAGHSRGGGNVRDTLEYLAAIEKAGLYGVMPFDGRLKGQRALLGYIHGDEPDLSHQVNDAKIEPSKDLRLNPSTPLWKILDGNLNSWSVLDPLEGASFTIALPKEVTVESLAVAVTISKGLALPKEVVFESAGKELLKATLTDKKGLQKFPLPKPASVKELTVKVVSVTPGDNAYGSLSEIEGYDKEGKNVLLFPPRHVPRAMPDATKREYAEIKAADSSRPVFMTLTAHFHPHFKDYTEAQRQALYPEYVKATDVVGYDIYPIYGWNKPEWLYLVRDATELLVSLAGQRPVYGWIETSKGGQWTGALERQKDVTPEHIRAEVWMSICGGATAIGYFTHIWKPSYSQFGVPEVNRRALREVNQQITRLTPAILGEPVEGDVKINAPGTTMLDAMARRNGGNVYVFAVNYDQQVKADVQMELKGLKAGTKIEVVDENRTVEAGQGSFTDAFAPLAVHIYRLKL